MLWSKDKSHRYTFISELFSLPRDGISISLLSINVHSAELCSILLPDPSHVTRLPNLGNVTIAFLSVLPHPVIARLIIPKPLSTLPKPKEKTSRDHRERQL